MVWNYERICRQIGVELTPFQHWACQYLESHGLRFCVDFGYENCEDKADEIGGSAWVM